MLFCVAALSNVDTSRPLAFDGNVYHRYKNAVTKASVKYYAVDIIAVLFDELW